MADPVALGAMSEAQEQSWHALLDVSERVNANWTLIGGQLVHLHCAERDESPPRPTQDIDAVVDVRASQTVLMEFTRALQDLGFTVGTSGDGVQHRWSRDLAQIDVLIPEGIGERTGSRAGAGGTRSIAAPGTTQALHRTEPKLVRVTGRTGIVLRPTLVAALIGKAAARTEIPADPKRLRHSSDFIVLASLVSARDFKEVELTTKDRSRLRKMLSCCRTDESATSMERATEILERLERAARLHG